MSSGISILPTVAPPLVNSNAAPLPIPSPPTVKIVALSFEFFHGTSPKDRLTLALHYTTIGFTLKNHDDFESKYFLVSPASLIDVSLSFIGGIKTQKSFRVSVFVVFPHSCSTPFGATITESVSNGIFSP
jgi:hypothetical protein